MDAAAAAKASIIYLSHGGGPLPLLDDPAHAELIAFLRAVPALLIAPRAILVISAHWETAVASTTAGAAPALVYDYHGFPPESYAIRYPAPGDPLLAAEVCELLRAAGIDAVADAARGFDHGSFVPLKLMYPGADVPVVQLSLLESMDPEAHLRLGAALAPLRARGVLILGSGSSFHNLRAFFAPRTPELGRLNAAFEQWLLETCAGRDIDHAERLRRLRDWERAPGARYCHPREEHLLPLHVCCAAGGGPAACAYGFSMMGVRSSAFLW